MKTLVTIASGALLSLQCSLAQQNELPDSGNVGIGTTNPTEKLDVRGAARIDSNVTVGETIIAKGAEITEDLTVTGNTLLKSNAEVVMDLSVGGKSTLGNTKIAGSLSLPNLVTAASTDGAALLVQKSDGTIEKSTLDAVAKDIYRIECKDNGAGVILNPLWNNGPNKLYVDCPQVNVGIGTNNPTHNLTVIGNSKFYNHAYLVSSLSLGADLNTFSKFYTKNTTHDAAIHVNNTGNTKDYQKLILLEYSKPNTEIIKVTNTTSAYNPFLLSTDGSMAIHNGAGKTFELMSDGKLIIGNGTTKNFQFETNGLFRARRIRVDHDTWADFVFEPTYKLMPILELGTYVMTNKHLPGIPTESEVISEGIDLGEMNKLLIQKVEELTLYLVEQQKQIDALKIQVERTTVTH